MAGAEGRTRVRAQQGGRAADKAADAAKAPTGPSNMLISCDCSIDDYDGPTISSCKLVKARRQHTCCECGDPIQPGQTYELVKGLWDGRWDTFKTCIGCTRIREDLCPHGWLHGGLAEQVQECLGFDYTLG